MADEFSIGVRATKQRIRNSGRAAVPYADNKPEALIQYAGSDAQLVRALGSIRRTLEVIQGSRGARADQGVTYRGLEAALKEFIQTLEKGSTGLTNTANTANTANSTATNAVADAAAALVVANQALLAANAAHTGEVTSPANSTVLTLGVSAISNKPSVSAEDLDSILLADATDGLAKKAVVSTLLDGGYF